LYYDMKAGGVLQKTTMQGPQIAVTFKFWFIVPWSP
jgi:hypothetical protein